MATKNGIKTPPPTSADESQKSPSRITRSQSRSDPKDTPSTPPVSFLVQPRIKLQERVWKTPITDSAEPQGFENATAFDCYRNCLLQLLMNLPVVVNALVRDKMADCGNENCITCALISVAEAYWSQDIERLNQAVRTLDECGNARDWNKFEGGDKFGQQDPHELLGWFETKLSEDSIMSHMFKFAFDCIFDTQIRETRTCRTDPSHVRHKLDTQKDWNLPIFQQLSGQLLTEKTAGKFERNYRVLESSEYLFRPVNEEGDCEVCGALNKRGLKKSQFIKEAPEVLLCLIGRMDDRGVYKFTDGYDYDVDEILDLTQFLRDEEKLAGKTLHYRLVGIGLHKGDTPLAGHYTTIVKGPTGKWFYMDDQKTARTGDDLKDILNPRLKAKFTPHLLTYQRTDSTGSENEDDEDPPTNRTPPNEPDPPDEADATHSARDPSLKNKTIYFQFGNNGSYQAKLIKTVSKSIKTKKRKRPNEWNEGDFLGLEDQRFIFRIGATDGNWLAGTMKLVEEKRAEKRIKPTDRRKIRNWSV